MNVRVPYILPEWNSDLKWLLIWDGKGDFNVDRLFVYFCTSRGLKIVLSIPVIWGYPFRELFKVGFAPIP